jgi:hypothetical protein
MGSRVRVPPRSPSKSGLFVICTLSGFVAGGTRGAQKPPPMVPRQSLNFEPHGRFSTVVQSKPCGEADATRRFHLLSSVTRSLAVLWRKRRKRSCVGLTTWERAMKAYFLARSFFRPITISMVLLGTGPSVFPASASAPAAVRASASAVAASLEAGGAFTRMPITSPRFRDCVRPMPLTPPTPRHWHDVRIIWTRDIANPVSGSSANPTTENVWPANLWTAFRTFETESIDASRQEASSSPFSLIDFSSSANLVASAARAFASAVCFRNSSACTESSATRSLAFAVPSFAASESATARLVSASFAAILWSEKCSLIEAVFIVPQVPIATASAPANKTTLNISNQRFAASGETSNISNLADLAFAALCLFLVSIIVGALRRLWRSWTIFRR